MSPAARAVFALRCAGGRAVASDATRNNAALRAAMKEVVIGTRYARVPKCEGLWADKDTLQQI